MEKEFTGLSSIQKEKFKEISGYDYKGGELKGSFKTGRPFNKEWDLSPWIFSFIFQKQTGYLFCELEHRMTNNRIYGWDYSGKELGIEIINEVFPAHL